MDHRIGFIGLGHMGTPMVKNLLKHKYRVTVFDVMQSAAQALAQYGAILAASVTDVVNHNDIIFTMLPTGQDVEKVWLNEQGLFSAAKPGTLLIDSSSIDVQTTRQLAKMAQKEGFFALDAPVSGGVSGAEAGTLTFMVGGDIQRYKLWKFTQLAARFVTNC